jgi:hypothetical protein
VDFIFSFANVTGDTNGTVTGRILGLSDNGIGQAAPSVLIDTFPAALAGSFNIGNDATLWEVQLVNSFDVSGGAITGATFGAFQGNGGADDGFRLNYTGNYWPTTSGISNQNWLTLDDTVPDVENLDGFAGVTFTPVAAVPLPGGLPLFLAALSAFGLIVIRRRSIARLNAA